MCVMCVCLCLECICLIVFEHVFSVCVIGVVCLCFSVCWLCFDVVWCYCG